MEGTALFQLPERMQVDQIHITENGLMIEVVATAPTAYCPKCFEPNGYTFPTLVQVGMMPPRQDFL